MPLKVRKFIKEHFPGRHVQADTLAPPTYVQTIAAPTHIQACVSPPGQYHIFLKSIPVVTKPYVPPTTRSGLRLPENDPATHFLYFGDDEASQPTRFPLPDTHPEGLGLWNDKDWKERIVYGNNEIHMFTTRGNEVKFILKVSRDESNKEKWFYQDFDPNSELVSKLKLQRHYQQLISKLQARIKAA